MPNSLPMKHLLSKSLGWWTMFGKIKNVNLVASRYFDRGLHMHGVTNDLNLYFSLRIFLQTMTE